MKQRMEVIALRNRFVNDWPVWDLIALDDENLLEEVGQHARSDQAGDAAADDNRLVSGPVVHGMGRSATPLLNPF
jgi:hypothetical protein